jgi:hypothetical protein
MSGCLLDPIKSDEDPSSARRLEIAVGIATAGRSEIVSCAIDLVARQYRKPDLLVVCPAAPGDVDTTSVAALPFATAVRIGKRGLTAQRNQILSAANDCDVIVFFDDDFFPRLDYLEQVERIFLENSNVVAITGRPIQDGINGPGLDAKFALELVLGHDAKRQEQIIAATYGTYGCNMAFRMDQIRRLNLSFDENLPLYGWQEDIDFSRQLANSGRIVDATLLRGVHLGTKSGRTSGVRFGYSQIANPVYLIRKGTMSRSFAWPLMWRNVLANLARSSQPEPWIDRRGRLRGNCLAFRDLLTGQISPQRILELS